MKLSALWALLFRFYFGEKILSKRQIFTIPAYTLTVSLLFFVVWIAYVYLIESGEVVLYAPLPISIRQAIISFYTEGLLAVLFMDVLAIQMTKICINIGSAHGFKSFRFIASFVSVFIISYFIYALVVLYFRLDDMLLLYAEYAPNDPIPAMSYEPFGALLSSLHLFRPQTIIHVTSQGWISTYFMPEPLIFYCLVTSHMALLMITVSYLFGVGMIYFKNLCIGTVRSVGTARTNANSIIIFVTLGLISIPVILMTLVALIINL